MTIASRLIARLLKLPPAKTYDVVLERDLPISMRDGTVLLADHYYPRQVDNVPTILLRSPYGRSGLVGLVLARPFAERGFQVLIQSCRGTFGSGDVFNAFRNEHDDGLDTLAWMEQQPWFSGEFATAGPSYLGLVQWALVEDAGPALKAMSLQITSSNFRTLVYPGESFGLDTALTWIQQLAHQEQGALVMLRDSRRRSRQKQAASMHLPLRDADVIITGKPVAFYRDWLEHTAPDDPWWKAVDWSDAADRSPAAIMLIGGWYDIFLPNTLADYVHLRETGKQPYLTVGPWRHTSAGAALHVPRDTLAWFQNELLGEQNLLGHAPVRLFVMGSNTWKNFNDWPPSGYLPQRWFLNPDKMLATRPADSSPPDRYRYDPSDPTPSIGGSSLSQNSGPRDNRKVEARSDILVYTSRRLNQDVEVVGPVTAELFVTSSLEHTDVFVRLCDVGPSGKSINVSDGLVRLRPGTPVVGQDGTWKVTIELWATAHCFKRGHRIRLQVAGGSHPRYVRNTGSGEPLATATQLLAADHAVYHDAEHQSSITLPVRA